MTIDLRRTVPLRIVDDLPDHDPATPGDAQPLVHTDGEPAGLIGSYLKDVFIHFRLRKFKQGFEGPTSILPVQGLKGKMAA